MALETSFSTTLMHDHDPTVRCQLVGEHSDKMFGQFEPWLTSLRFSLALPAHILEKVLEEARSCFRSSYVCQCAMTWSSAAGHRKPYLTHSWKTFHKSNLSWLHLNPRRLWISFRPRPIFINIDNAQSDLLHFSEQLLTRHILRIHFPQALQVFQGRLKQTAWGRGLLWIKMLWRYINFLRGG